MVALNFNSMCKEAEAYYYDFLSRDGLELVPESIIMHIKQCQYCQEQISQLTRVLSVVGGQTESENGQVSSSTAMMLKLHLAYIGKPVSCETVRPFLPSLLDPALRIGIPTPITVHIENCQKCSEDLESIQKLNLSRRQLRRLSQMFADGDRGDEIGCAEAQNAIPSVVSMVFSETAPQVLKHICVCPDCREQLYQRREMVLRGLKKTSLVEDKFPCERVSARDFFDYAVPYGFDAAGDQYARFRESLTSHLRTCPTCLSKMQELHRTIFGICESSELGVVTVYRIDESAKAETVGKADVPYAGFPVRVEVNGHRETEAEVLPPKPAVDFAAFPRRKTLAMAQKPLFKAAVAAAAVITIAAVLLLNGPTARAVTLSQIYKAVDRFKNVYIAKFAPDKTEPVQEKWISRTLNIYITKADKQCILLDIANGVTKTKYLNTDKSEITKLPVGKKADIEGRASSNLGLVPFTHISEIPADAQWSRVIDNSLEDTSVDTEIYDLTWTEKSSENSVIYKKWRFFVNPKTNLPQRTEFSEKLPTDSDYVLESINVVEYLNDAEMQAVVKTISF